MQFAAFLALLAIAAPALAAPSVGPAAGLQIEKRASCSVPTYGEGLCLVHCLALDYCDSYCTSKCASPHSCLCMPGADVLHRNICTCEGKRHAKCGGQNLG
jgi:hypothetical protein